MGSVHDISDRYKKRIYKTDNCAGCGRVITKGETFTQVVLPNGDESETHIALCKKCKKSADQYGVW